MFFQDIIASDFFALLLFYSYLFVQFIFNLAVRVKFIDFALNLFYINSCHEFCIISAQGLINLNSVIVSVRTNELLKVYAIDILMARLFSNLLLRAIEIVPELVCRLIKLACFQFLFGP